MSEPPNDMPPDLIPDELHVLAGEYVLGALEAAEMRAVRRRAMADPTLAAAISGWEQRLAPMTQAVPIVAPPEALWARIEEDVAPLPEDAAEPPEPLTVGPRPTPRLASVLPPPEPPPSELARLRPLPSRRRRVWPWQLATVASLALAAGVAGLVLMPAAALRMGMPMLGERYAPEVALLMPPAGHADTRQDGTLPQMAADSSTPRFLGDARPDGGAPQIAADTRMPGFLAQARPDGTVVLTAVARVEVPQGKALELWMQPPGATAPKSLGVLPGGGHRITLREMPPPGTSLLVSLEPAGGSPTGQPTGQVVYSGKLGQQAL